VIILYEHSAFLACGREEKGSSLDGFVMVQVTTRECRAGKGKLKSSSFFLGFVRRLSLFMDHGSGKNLVSCIVQSSQMGLFSARGRPIELTLYHIYSGTVA